MDCISPEVVMRVILLDADFFFNTDIKQLFDHFDNFNEKKKLSLVWLTCKNPTTNHSLRITEKNILEPRLARRRQMASRDTMEVLSCFTWVTCELKIRALQANPSWQRYKKKWCKIPIPRTSKWARFLRFVRCETSWAVLCGQLCFMWSAMSAMSPFWHTGRLWCLSRLS